MPEFLSPYRGERYYLHDFKGRRRQPQGREELFNYRHSSLWNVIERYFGVLKAWFPILKQMPPYPMQTHTYIPIACCTIHNFIKLHAHQDLLIFMSLMMNYWLLMMIMYKMWEAIHKCQSMLDKMKLCSWIKRGIKLFIDFGSLLSIRLYIIFVTLWINCKV